MALQSSPLDDPASFRALMIECHMPSIQIEHIVTSGYTTIALLAHGVHDESKMEEFVELPQPEPQLVKPFLLFHLNQRQSAGS